MNISLKSLVIKHWLEWLKIACPENYCKVIQEDNPDRDIAPWILEAAKEYGETIRDKSLEWAAENAETKVCCSDYYSDHMIIDRYSILSGKSHPDLKIQ